MDQKPRRHHSPEDKVRILRLHLLERKPISELCEQEGIHPTLFYQWQKAFFENGAAAFQRSPRTETQKRAGLIEALQARIQRKDEVIAEIAEDLIREKKANGGS